MKQFVYKLVTFIGKILGTCFSVYRLNQIQWMVNILYSEIVRRSLKKSGKEFYIEHPANIRNAKYIYIGDNFYSGARLRIEAYDTYNGQHFVPEINIGNNVNINFDCHIGCINKIRIGNGVLIASKVLIIDHSHGDLEKSSFCLQPSERPLFSKGSVYIEDNVWIGEGSVILPNVTIGKNCIIGANSVVTKSFPPNCVICGNPAKVIKSIDNDRTLKNNREV